MTSNIQLSPLYNRCELSNRDQSYELKLLLDAIPSAPRAHFKIKADQEKADGRICGRIPSLTEEQISIRSWTVVHNILVT